MKLPTITIKGSPRIGDTWTVSVMVEEKKGGEIEALLKALAKLKLIKIKDERKGKS